jgi:predicted nucleic acid-binding protein
MDLDKGEASAIALSLELDNSIVIIDDLKGRNVAERLNLRYSGTFGLILKAKQIGIIQSVKPILTKIRETNFRFSEKLFKVILEQAGE